MVAGHVKRRFDTRFSVFDLVFPSILDNRLSKETYRIIMEGINHFWTPYRKWRAEFLNYQSKSCFKCSMTYWWLCCCCYCSYRDDFEAKEEEGQEIFRECMVETKSYLQLTVNPQLEAQCVQFAIRLPVISQNDPKFNDNHKIVIWPFIEIHYAEPQVFASLAHHLEEENQAPVVVLGAGKDHVTPGAGDGIELIEAPPSYSQHNRSNNQSQQETIARFRPDKTWGPATSPGKFAVTSGKPLNSWFGSDSLRSKASISPAHPAASASASASGNKLSKTASSWSGVFPHPSQTKNTWLPNNDMGSTNQLPSPSFSRAAFRTGTGVGRSTTKGRIVAKGQGLVIVDAAHADIHDASTRQDFYNASPSKGLHV